MIHWSTLLVIEAESETHGLHVLEKLKLKEMQGGEMDFLFTEIFQRNSEHVT